MKLFISTISIGLLGTTIAFSQKSAPLQAIYLHQLRNDDAGGSVSIDRWGFRGGVPLINEKDNLLAIGFRYALERYDFEETTADWGSIHNLSLSLASRVQVNDRWRWGNYATAGVSAEEGSDKDQGFNFNLISIAEYEVNDRFTIGPGIGISSQVDQDLSAFPIIAVNWQISDEWRLASGPSEVALTGANVYFEYIPKVLHEKWTFTTGFSFSSQNFKIADNVFVSDGSGEERLASVYLATGYKMDSGVKLSAIAGYNIFQSYSIYDGGGNELSKETLADSPFFGVTVGFEF